MIAIENRNTLIYLTNDKYMRNVFKKEFLTWFKNAIGNYIYNNNDNSIISILLDVFIRKDMLNGLRKNILRFTRENEINLSINNIMEIYISNDVLLSLLFDMELFIRYIDNLTSEDIFALYRINDYMEFFLESQFIKGQKVFVKWKHV